MPCTEVISYIEIQKIQDVRRIVFFTAYEMMGCSIHVAHDVCVFIKINNDSCSM